MPVTLKDIAVRVNKSVATVSRALGGFNDISPETRAEVLRVAAELGYVPNAAARQLQKQRADSIGIILSPDQDLRLSDPFFSTFLAGAVDSAAALGFSLSITNDTHHGEHESYLRHIRSRRVDGYIINRTRRQDERIALLQEQGVPFAAFGRVDGDNDFAYVDEDGTHSVKELVRHLVGLGHRRLAFVAEPLNLTKAFHRLQGFQLGLRESGLTLDPKLVVEAGFRQRSGQLAAARLLDLPDPPTAILACNDLLALGALAAARERGMTVGRDVSITGFDDIMLAALVTPTLTTVQLPAHQLGGMVTERLVQLIKGEAVAPSLVLKPEIVIRNSTGPARMPATRAEEVLIE